MSIFDNNAILSLWADLHICNFTCRSIAEAALSEYRFHSIDLFFAGFGYT
jgi:hypothetical protein